MEYDPAREAGVEEFRQRYNALEVQMMDVRSPLFIDGVLDCIQNLVLDCNFPVIRKNKTIESFLQRYERSAVAVRDTRLRIQDFEFIKLIGKGAFGEVSLVRLKANKRVYAMKMLNKFEMIKRQESAFFWEEREIMASANSEWIVQLHFAFQDAKYLYMVMDFMAGGDLVNIIENYEITEVIAKFYLAEVTLAVDTIHTLGFVHRDIKPDNMLVDSRGHLKLADFGTCIRMDKNGMVRSDTAVGTPGMLFPCALRAFEFRSLLSAQANLSDLSVYALICVEECVLLALNC